MAMAVKGFFLLVREPIISFCWNLMSRGAAPEQNMIANTYRIPLPLKYEHLYGALK
jgi:hypothetical protein